MFLETLTIRRLQNIFWELNIHLLHHVLYGRISANNIVKLLLTPHHRPPKLFGAVKIQAVAI